MIYLHCGWPKTGTTSLQAAMAKRRDQLDAAGVFFPDRWHSGDDQSNNGLVDQLKASPDSRREVLAELTAFLAVHSEEDILLSIENLTICLLMDRHSQLVLDLLDVLQVAAPVRCIWTLRRFDDMTHSMYLRARPQGYSPEDLTRTLQTISIGALPSRMLEVEHAAAGSAGYVKYDKDGGHNAKLLRAFGIPAQLVEDIASELSSTARLHTGLTHKAMVAVLNAEELSTRAGIKLDKVALQDIFYTGFGFTDDRPSDLMDRDVRRNLHGRMLDSSRRVGFAPYIRFFGQDRIGFPAAPHSMDLETLSDEDVNRLVDHIL